MILDHCVSCKVRIVRDSFSKEEYFEKYGNYCRTCSANPKKAMKKRDVVQDDIQRLYHEFDLEHPTEEQYQLLKKAFKKELGNYYKNYEEKNN